MIEKLELKHLAGSLPYRLTGTEYIGAPTYVLESLSNDKFLWRPIYKKGECSRLPRRIDCKPILHPLSDLTKPCLEGGKIPVLELVYLAIERGVQKDYSPSFDYDIKVIKKPFGKIIKVSKLDTWYFMFSFNEPDRLKHFQFEKLFEWHFDIYGLIESGLAIDINILK